ncbi:hypothetical protein BOTBODRAFT_53511 [Botryobasidium botryosum FD-172 SS1]|uniref:FZ domain-containing protein n=1 Tax=Botryobasidium botryosum (strain FD-172 SS1) TaxID=930990 RepID=A0A067MPE7_BOTB1|nr:hypothetical protein BOTBODRAFT_53511 [Botryobasidium botryosum FD-172 SS1]
MWATNSGESRTYQKRGTGNRSALINADEMRGCGKRKVEMSSDTRGRPLDTTELPLSLGAAAWTGSTPAGGLLAAWSQDQNQPISLTLEIGLSHLDPIREPVPNTLLLGDTTSNQAIFFSPVFAQVQSNNLTYPNYTLPAGNLSSPAIPSNPPNDTLLLIPTASLPVSLTHSACAIKNVSTGFQAQASFLINRSSVLRDANGWRAQWFVEGLTSFTNYTAFIIKEDGISTSGPLNFLTKSAAFPCPLVHSLPYCPQIAYAVPLPPPPLPLTSYISTTVPTNVSAPLISSLTNFTTSLLSFPCGRDVYSPLRTCADCQTSYRNWACAVSFPRCGENSIPASVPDSVPRPALLSHPPKDAPRATGYNPLDVAYNELLPCIENCQAVLRDCPAMLGWACPVMDGNANMTYGVGYVDSMDGGIQQGWTGAAQDEFGWVWCNSAGA